MDGQRSPNEFHAAWHWLRDHPLFRRVDPTNPDHTWSAFDRLLDIWVAAVNPATEAVDDDPALNTAVAVWLEAGPWVDDPPDARGHGEYHGPSHDMRIDCGGPDFETAIIALAAKVRAHYRDDGTAIADAVDPEATGSPCGPDDDDRYLGGTGRVR